MLYLLICAGDGEVVHDNWHPDRAEFLLEVRRKILQELQHRDELSAELQWPKKWPDFQKYTYCSG